jgi:hypothetical protein
LVFGTTQKIILDRIAGQFADYLKISAFDPNLNLKEQRLDWQHTHGHKQQPNQSDSRLPAAEHAIGRF